MKKWTWFLISLLVVLIDQSTKHLAYTQLTPYQPYPIMPWVNLTLAYNSGAAFSFLSSSGTWHHWFFIGFSTVMSVFLIIWLIKLSKTATLQALGLSLILGGALGNLIDRILIGHVIDFIDLYYKNHHWFVFNIADAAICVGAVFLLVDLLRKEKLVEN